MLRPVVFKEFPSCTAGPGVAKVAVPRLLRAKVVAAVAVRVRHGVGYFMSNLFVECEVGLNIVFILGA